MKMLLPIVEGKEFPLYYNNEEVEGCKISVAQPNAAFPSAAGGAWGNPSVAMPLYLSCITGLTGTVPMIDATEEDAETGKLVTKERPLCVDDLAHVLFSKSYTEIMMGYILPMQVAEPPKN